MKFETYFWAPLATSIGIIISVTLWFLNRQRKALSYEVISSDAVVNLKGSAKQRLEVKFDHKIVHDAKLVIVKVINSGHIPITPGDYQTRLSISVPDGAQIVFADVLQTAPADLEERLSGDESQQTLIERLEETSVYLRPILLNTKDSATIQMLVNNLIGTVHVRAHIQGISSIGKLRHRTWLQTILVQVGALVMAAAMLAVEPRDVVGFGLQELLPSFLLFLLGYIILFAGLYAPKRLKNKVRL